jgi:hypothetical protein
MQMDINQIVKFIKNCQNKNDLNEIIIHCKDGSGMRFTIFEKDNFEAFFQ